MGHAHRLRVRGRVQGVGFRYFVLRRAEELGVEGWVRNRTDGTVEALVWADEATMNVFVGAVRQGPRWGLVERLDVTVEPDGGEAPAGFAIRPDC